MATATAKRVKVSKVSGSVRRRAKPITKADVQQIVDEAVYMNDPLVRMYNGGAALVSSAGAGLQNILDGLAHVAGQVWVFLGNVYATVVEYTTAVLNWIGEQISYAIGATRKALEYVYEFVGSMTVDWVAVNGHVVNLMAAAAAFGVAVTTGAAVGVGMAGIATAVVGAGTAAKVTGILFAAITANCVAPVAYTLFQAGISRELIAESLTEAEKKSVTVNAVAVTPATT